MTHLSVRAAALAAAAVITLSTSANVGRAQCATCPTPVVAFSPVVAAPTTVVAPATVVVAPRMGLFDRWRMRRWGVAMPVVAAPVMATPVYGAQTVTAGFAPMVTATPAHVTAFAPLQRQVVQTTLMPVTTASACAPCSAAPIVTTSFFPTTVLQPVTVTPIVSAPTCTTCASPVVSCDACACATPCSSCPTSSAIEQAAFAAPSSDCPSCSGGSAEPYYGTPASAGDPQTPTPELPTDFGTPVESGYVPETTDGATDGSGAFSAPPLMTPPFNGQTASRPTVDVRTAVFRRPVGATTVSATSAPVRRAVDAGGWSTTPASR